MSTYPYPRTFVELHQIWIYISQQKGVEKCRCKILSRGWILGIYLSFVGLQDIQDNDQNVYPKVSK